MIVGVAVVWILIIFKIIGMAKPDKVNVAKQKFSKPLEKTRLELDTFSINPTYRDPFLGKYAYAPRKTSVVPKKSKKPPKKVVQKPKVTVKFPVIQFYGLIRNSTKGSDVAIVRIEDRDYFMEKNDEQSGVKLLEIFADSIKVEFKGENRFVSVMHI